MSKNWQIARGAFAAWDIPITREGEALDLTGHTVTWHAMRDSYAGEEVLTKTLTPADPTTGIVTVQIGGEADLPFADFPKPLPETLYWVLKVVKDSDGWTDKDLGTLEVLPSGP